MPANPNFDVLLTTTLKNYRKTLEDNVFGDRPLVAFLRQKGRIEMQNGGESIVVPLLTGANSTAKSYSGYDTLDITAQEGISAAEFPWRQFAATVAISGIEEAKNAGQERIINLLQAKVQQAEESIVDKMDQMFFGDGTGNGGKDWLGLNAIVGTGTLGGINPATAGNEFWQSVVVAAGADGSAIRDDSEWTRAYNTASKGNNHPDFAITTQDLYEHYEEGLAPQLRFTDNKAADGRFQNLLFKNIPLFFDTYCPAGTTFFLNSRYIKLVGHTQAWFKNTPFKEVPDKDARWSQILSYGNLVTSNRSRLARVNGQTVS